MMIKLNMKKYSVLTEKQQKHQHYHQEKLEKILPSDQSRIIVQAKFTYSHLSKAFEKQIKTIEDQREKQIKALDQYGKQLVKYSDEKKSLTHSKQK